MFYRGAFISAKRSMSLSTSITLTLANPFRRSWPIQLQRQFFICISSFFINISFCVSRKRSFCAASCSTTNLFILGSIIINWILSSVSVVFITCIVLLYSTENSYTLLYGRTNRQTERLIDQQLRFICICMSIFLLRSHVFVHKLNLQHHIAA